MKKRYSVVDIVEEKNSLHATNPELQEFLFVAIIKDEKQEQPFRVLIENFETVEEAQEQIALWIAAREAEDMQAEEESMWSKRKTKASKALSSLKKAIIS
jgi:hypothetical protein